MRQHLIRNGIFAVHNNYESWQFEIRWSNPFYEVHLIQQYLRMNQKKSWLLHGYIFLVTAQITLESWLLEDQRRDILWMQHLSAKSFLEQQSKTSLQRSSTSLINNIFKSFLLILYLFPSEQTWETWWVRSLLVEERNITEVRWISITKSSRKCTLSHALLCGIYPKTKKP